MASIFNALPQLRTAAPQLSRRFFGHRSCLNTPFRTTSLASQWHRHRPSIPQSLNLNPTQCIKSNAMHRKYTAEGIANGDSNARKAAFKTPNLFPSMTSKTVAYWLLGSAASVFGIVIFGGLTRLTESGLSITEWRPVTGTLWPMNEADWESEFSKYRASPEFALLNSSITLADFKQIYFMEWAHRLWGRVIGVTFLLPTIYFIARRRVTSTVAAKLAGICGLIGFQGVIGWWMVKSGLKNDLFEPGSHPRVSQYRLTAHLGTAFIVYCSMLHTGLSILKERKMMQKLSATASAIIYLQTPALRRVRLSIIGLTLLVFTTAMSGALVAGLDAGLIYNEFPWMGLGLTPPKKELFDPFYSHIADQSDLWWRNMLENPSLVQLDHRILATTTFTSVMALFTFMLVSRRLRGHQLKGIRRGIWTMASFASLQITLGISTLIYMVPTWMASAHQAGALALLSSAVFLYSRVSLPGALIIRRAMSLGVKHHGRNRPKMPRRGSSGT